MCLVREEILRYEGGFDEVKIGGFERLLPADYGAD